MSIFILLFSFNFFIINTQQPYKSYFLQEFQKIITICDKGIYFYNISNIESPSQLNKIFENYQKITSSEEDMISLITFNSEVKVIYIIVKNYIYSFSENSFISEYKIENITDRTSSLIGHDCKEEGTNINCYFFIAFINSEKKLQIFKYNNQYNTNVYTCMVFQTIDLINSSGETSLSKYDGISCQQAVNEIDSLVLVCFFENENTELGAINLNVETLERDTSKDIRLKRNSGAIKIESILFASDKKIFVCYINENYNIACIIYDVCQNKFEKEIKYIEKITHSHAYFSLNYFDSTDKYILSSYSSDTEFEFILLRDQMNVCDNENNNKNYLTNFTLTPCSITSNNSNAIIYYYNNQYNIAQKCGINDFTSYSISNFCNKYLSLNEFIFDDNSESSLELSNEFSNDLKINKFKTNKTLDLFINDLNIFINEINLGEVYEIIGEDYFVKIGPINYNKFEDTLSYINFLECENTLKHNYHISPNNELTEVIIEIENNEEKALTNQIEYAIFDGKKQLDLSICQKDEIEINYEISNHSSIDLELVKKFSEIGIDILNIKDKFFNDICYPYSDNNSDMILRDRISIIYQNYSMCEENCEYEKVDLIDKIITCKCSIKTKLESKIKPLRFDNILLDLITDSSFGVIKCYNLVFNFKTKLENIGFLIFSLLILIHIPIIIHYIIYTITSITKYILYEMKKNNYISNINNPNKHLRKRKRKKTENTIYNNNNLINNNFQKIRVKKKLKTNIDNTHNNNLSKIKNSNFSIDDKLENDSKDSFKNMINQGNNIRELIKKSERKNISIYSNKNENSKHNIKFKENTKEESNKIKKKYDYSLIQINANNSLNNTPPDSKYFLDNYGFEEAIKFEKRTFSRIYYICLLSKDNILNIILIESPLELKSLRICMIIFIYSCDLALNTLFYFNDNISDKYNYNGDNLYLFTILNILSISIISTVLSFIIVNILQFLTNSKDSVEELFRGEEKKMRENYNYTVSKKKKKEILIRIHIINKILKIKILIFFIIELLIMIFFYYFVTSFCEVYKETQISWITDSIISFLLSFPLEFFLSLIIAFFYLIAVEKKIKWLYKIVMCLYNLS